MENRKVPFQGKPTGFKCGVDSLLVGDILSVRSGYGGFMRVVEHADGFWLEDWRQDESLGVNEAEKLNGDIDTPYRKVNPNDPYSEPPFPIMCDQCKETVIGYFGVYDGSVTWTDDCGEHHEEIVHSKSPFLETEPEGTEYSGKCKACVSNPKRAPKSDPLLEYFKKRYLEAGLSLRALDFPQLKSEAEVDRFIEDLKAIQKFMGHNLKEASKTD